MYASDWIMDFLLPEVWYAVHVSCVVESAQPVTYARHTNHWTERRSRLTLCVARRGRGYIDLDNDWKRTKKRGGQNRKLTY